MRRGAGASVHEQLGTTVLHQKLPAPPAGRQRQAVASGHTDGNQTAVTTGHERRHKAAFAAEREPERHVLDVARRHHVAVLAQPGGAYSEPRIRRIRVCRGSIRSPAEAGPIEAGPIEAGPIEAGPIEAGLIEVLRRLLGRRLSSSWHPRETSNRELASCRRYSPQGVLIQNMAGQDLAGAPRSVQPPVVVVLGDVMVDVVVRPLGPFNRGSDTVSRILVAPGGSATNLAVAMAGAGAQVHLVAVIGDDQLGRTTMQALATTGVLAHFKIAAGEHTGMVVALVDEAGERSMFTDRGANLRLQAQMLDPDLLGPGKHLHLSGYDLLDAETRPGRGGGARQRRSRRDDAFGRPLLSGPARSCREGSVPVLDRRSRLVLCKPGRGPSPRRRRPPRGGGYGLTPPLPRGGPHPRGGRRPVLWPGPWSPALPSGPGNHF